MEHLSNDHEDHPNHHENSHEDRLNMEDRIIETIKTTTTHNQRKNLQSYHKNKRID